MNSSQDKRHAKRVEEVAGESEINVGSDVLKQFTLSESLIIKHLSFESTISYTVIALKRLEKLNTEIKKYTYFFFSSIPSLVKIAFSEAGVAC